MNNPTQPRTNGAQHSWIGYALGIACMAGLFIPGVATSTPGLVIMSSSLAVLLGALWATASTTAKKRARP